MTELTAKVGPGGRVVLPAAYRKALGIQAGDDVVLLMEDDEIRIMPLRRAVARAQALVRRYIPQGTHLADELIADRRTHS